MQTDRHRELEEYLVNSLGGRPITMENALAEASEDSSLVFLTPTGLKATRVEDALSVLHTPFSSSVIFMRIINDGKTGFLDRAQLGPGL